MEDDMGDWNAQPPGNDEAADWFQRFWKKSDFSILVDEIRNFDEREERYDSVRAASYLLQTLGIVYVWPAEHREELKPLLREAISILTKMIDPPNGDWGFLDMWGNSADVIEAVKEQIIALRVRLSELA
jgi:hypothetical protein